MAITWLIEDTFKLGRNKVIRALLRENGTVKRVEVTIPRNASPTMQDVQAAWDAAPALPNGVKEWNKVELRDTDDVGREVVDAILEIVRANGTLAQMVAAGETALAAHNRQQAAYTRISTALIAGTNNQRMQFLALLATVAFGKIGQR